MADRIRLLVVGVRWPPEPFLYRLLVGLARAGVEVTVATAKKPVVEGGVRVQWLPTPAWEGGILFRLFRLAKDGGKGLIRSPSDLWRLNRIWFSGSASVVPYSMCHRGHVRFWHRFLPFVGRRWDVIYFPWNSGAIEYRPLFDWECPVVVSCRGSQVNVAPHNPKRYAIRDGLQETFSRAAAVHCVSEAIKREATRYGLDPAKAWVIRPAVDPDFFKPVERDQPKSRGFYQIITTGSLLWRKGYEYALLAIRSLVDKGISVRFEIIGDGPEQQRVLYTIHDLELEQYVHLVGYLPPEEVKSRLQQADVFLLSSLSEGISNAVLEAMACGLPVVTTDCGGMREAVTNGIEGFVVPVRDVEATVNALMKLWCDAGLRWKMGQAARKRILKDFTLDQHIQKWKELLTTVVVG